MNICVSQANDIRESVREYTDVLAMHARSSGKHTLTQNPDAADLILVVGHIPNLGAARKVSLLRRYPEKAMIYSEIDAAIPFASGIYCSAARPRWIDLRRTRNFTYLSSYGSVRNKEVRLRPALPKELLFCFRGRRDCRVRARLMDTNFGRPDVLVMDTTAYSHWNEGRIDRQQGQKEYAETLLKSHFALCPRGAGFGSIRLFEVMEMGIAPVLLSDRYALPTGPAWDSFLLQFPEADYARLPELLQARVAESAERGRKAREAWENFFAPELAFDRLIDQLVDIRCERVVPEKLFRLAWPLLQLRATGRRRLASIFRKALLKLRPLTGRKTPPSGFVASDLE